jgi:hypothetical protein
MLEALCYKPVGGEGGSTPDTVIDFFFNSPNPSSRIMALVFTQPLIEMSTRNLSWGEARPTRKVDMSSTQCPGDITGI